MLRKKSQSMQEVVTLINYCNNYRNNMLNAICFK